jgi:hypothetical protein
MNDAFSAPPSHMLVITRSQAAAAQNRYEAMIAEYESKRTTTEPNPVDYWVYKGFWAAAYGAEAVQVVEDPPSPC